jgi:hypothetical protein
MRYEDEDMMEDTKRKAKESQLKRLIDMLTDLGEGDEEEAEREAGRLDESVGTELSDEERAAKEDAERDMAEEDAGEEDEEAPEAEMEVEEEGEGDDEDYADEMKEFFSINGKIPVKKKSKTVMMGTMTKVAPKRKAGRPKKKRA